jgi:hypothetical protein
MSGWENGGTGRLSLLGLTAPLCHARLSEDSRLFIGEMRDGLKLRVNLELFNCVVK